MIKALFFDIDGTLVSFNTHAIPQSTIDAIYEVKRKGIKVFISTGRPKVIINNLGDLEFDGFITMNGSYCFVENHKVILKSSIPSRAVNTLASLVHKESMPCIFVQEKKIFVSNPGKMTDDFSAMLNIPPLEVVEPEEIAKTEIFQISPFFTPEQEKEWMPLVPECIAGRWHPAFADVVSKESGKDRGVDAIIKHFNINLEETMSFGDGGNDITMLKHTAIGVAMGNGYPDVKAAADYVTDTVDNDGIFKALKYFEVI